MQPPRLQHDLRLGDDLLKAIRLNLLRRRRAEPLPHLLAVAAHAVVAGEVGQTAFGLDRGKNARELLLGLGREPAHDLQRLQRGQVEDAERQSPPVALGLTLQRRRLSPPQALGIRDPVQKRDLFLDERRRLHRLFHDAAALRVRATGLTLRKRFQQRRQPVERTQITLHRRAVPGEQGVPVVHEPRRRQARDVLRVHLAQIVLHAPAHARDQLRHRLTQFFERGLQESHAFLRLLNPQLVSPPRFLTHKAQTRPLGLNPRQLLPRDRQRLFQPPPAHLKDGLTQQQVLQRRRQEHVR